MTRRILPALVVLALAGCTAAPSPRANPTPDPSAPASFARSDHAPAWVEPARYTFVLERRCADKPSLGQYKVAVTNGQVTAVARIDGKTAEGEEEIEVPSLGGLLTMAQTALEDGGEVLTTRDSADGHPVAVAIDVAGDGGECFTITDYAIVTS